MPYYDDTILGGEHMTTTIYSFEDISSQKFLSGMIKGVFGTYYLQPDKFPLFYTDPPVGRTFVADRLKKRCPIDQRAAEKLYVLYKFILEGKSNYELVPLTERFSRQFANLLDMEIEFLQIYSDDTEEMRRKKCEYLLMLWKEVVDKFIDQVFVPLNQFQNNRFTLLRDIFMKMKYVCMENTYTNDVLRRWEEREYSENIPQILEKKPFIPNAVPLFIYGYAGTMAQPFLHTLLKKTQHMFELSKIVTDRVYSSHHNVLMLKSDTLFVSRDEFNEKVKRKELFHICNYQMETSFREAYSVALINAALADGKCVCILGDLDELQAIRQVFPLTQSVLILPKNVNETVYDFREYKSAPGAVIEQLKYLNNAIKKIMKEDEDTLVFFADIEDMSEVAGAVESHLLLMQHTLKCNIETLNRYTYQVAKNL